MSERPDHLPPRHHLDESCPHCGAPVGAECRAPLGRLASPHKARLTRLAYKAKERRQRRRARAGALAAGRAVLDHRGSARRGRELVILAERPLRIVWLAWDQDDMTARHYELRIGRLELCLGLPPKRWGSWARGGSCRWRWSLSIAWVGPTDWLERAEAIHERRYGSRP